MGYLNFKERGGERERGHTKSKLERENRRKGKLENRRLKREKEEIK